MQFGSALPEMFSQEGGQIKEIDLILDDAAWGEAPAKDHAIKHGSLSPEWIKACEKFGSKLAAHKARRLRADKACAERSSLEALGLRRLEIIG